MIFSFLAGFLCTISFIPQLLSKSEKINTHFLIIYGSGVICWGLFGLYLSNLFLILISLIQLIFVGIIYAKNR